MTLADQARNQAISLEAKKDALRQKQSGDWTISFTVQSVDMDPRITKASMGTRYAMVLVEIGDDEQPVQRKEASPAPCQDAHPQQTDGAKGKLNWRDMQPTAQAAIRCNEPAFQKFLNETRKYEISSAEEAAEAVRDVCGVSSRSELSIKHAARVIWHQLDTEYQAWMRVS